MIVMITNVFKKEEKEEVGEEEKEEYKTLLYLFVYRFFVSKLP